jgi:hypothetical protein
MLIMRLHCLMNKKCSTIPKSTDLRNFYKQKAIEFLAMLFKARPEEQIVEKIILSKSRNSCFKFKQ